MLVNYRRRCSFTLIIQIPNSKLSLLLVVIVIFHYMAFIVTRFLVNVSTHSNISYCGIKLSKLKIRFARTHSVTFPSQLSFHTKAATCHESTRVTAEMTVVVAVVDLTVSAVVGAPSQSDREAVD